jgi:bile acid:Na+ symporter, BASS family
MSLTTLIPLVIKISVALTVFVLGLQVRRDDLVSLFRQPAKLPRALLAMDVIMPVVAVLLGLILDPHPAVKVALVALSLSPVPPALPRRMLEAGGRAHHAFGLLAAAWVVAALVAPLALGIIGRIFGRDVNPSPIQVLQVFLITALLPLGCGMLVKRFLPDLAQRIAKPVSIVATAALLIAFVAIVIIAWPAIVSITGSGALVAFFAFVVIGLATGQLLGGPDPAGRTALALSTSTRHPGVAMAVASANFPELELVLAAVLVYMLVGMVVSIPYAKWRSRRSA